MPATAFTPATTKPLAWLAAAALVATFAIAVQQHHRTTLKLADPAGGHVSDFDRWMIMAPQFVHGGADYVTDELPTPPLSLLVLGPLAALSRPDAAFVWVLLKLPLAISVFLMAARIVARAGVTLTPEAVALVVAGWWLAVVVDMQEGQTNFLALAPLVAGLLFAQRQTRAGDAAAGALIGLGAAMKVTPIVFVVYFAWRRRWTIAASALASVAACSLIVPAIAFGWQQNLRWFGQWARIMILPYVSEGAVVYSTSQSVPSAALRLLTDAPAFDSHHGGVTESHFMNVLSLSNAAARQILRLCTVAAGAAGLWWTRRPLAALRSPRYVVEIGAVAAFMLWFSERTWVHHYISFLPTLMAAGMVLSDPRCSTRSARTVRAALVLFAATTLLASEAGKLLGPDGVDWAKAAGVYLWPSMAVTIAVLTASARRGAGAGEPADFERGVGLRDRPEDQEREGGINTDLPRPEIR
ncbi:MAG: DUF2029 domain-containing protein [Acidobacteria bacterium]|nr:DUF2029 domain-containing protein [Acidobacteriota bacterium]